MGLVLISVLIFLLVVGSITSQPSDISTKTSQAADKLEGWLKSLGIENTATAKKDLKNAARTSGTRYSRASRSVCRA